MNEKPYDFSQFFDVNQEKIVFLEKVRQILPGGEYRQYLLILTSFYLRFYTRSDESDTNDLEEITKLPHCDLISLSSLDEITFRFTYINNSIYTITTQNSEMNFIETITQTLSHIIPESRIAKIFSNNQIEHQFDRQFDDVQLRYQALHVWCGKPFPNQDLLQALNRYLNKRPISIDLGIISDYSFDVPILLDSLQMQPLIQTIIVPFRPNSNFYQIISAFLPQSIYMKHLVIHDKVPNSFYDTIINLYSADNDSNESLSIENAKPISCHMSSILSSIEFVNCIISTRLVKFFESLLKNGHKISLKFTECNIRNAEPSFASLMDQNNINLLGIYMKSINLSDSEHFRIASLRLRNLSLKGCNIRVEEIFSMLQTVYTPCIEYLDLSNNFCTSTQFNRQLVLPITIHTIILDHISWTRGILISVLESAVNSNKNMNLSLSYATLQNHLTFRDVFDQLKKNKVQATSLRSLMWKGNECSQSLFQFLKTAPELQFLSLSHSTIKKSTHFVDFLDNFQSRKCKNKTFPILDIQDLQTDYNTLKDILKAVFAKNRPVKKVNISHNQINDKLFSTIVSLIGSNSNVQQILMDDLSLVTYSVYQDLFKFLEMRNKKPPLLFIQFPKSDFHRFKNSIGSDKIEEFLDKKRLFVDPYIDSNPVQLNLWDQLLIQSYLQLPDKEEIQINTEKTVILDESIIEKMNNYDSDRPSSERSNRNSNSHESSHHSHRSKNTEESSSSNLRCPLQPASSSSSRSQHNEIQFSFIEIPTFDNDLILRNFEAKNSIKHLNKKLFESLPKQ